jgi:hypothetical protein
MMLVLRVAAVSIAIAGVIDPAITRQAPSPRAVEFRLPPASDPGFAAAAALRARIAAELESSTVTAAALTPRAILAIGNADVEPTGESQIFAVPLPPASPSTVISSVAVSPRTVKGQSARIAASVRGVGLSGRTSSIALEVRGTVLERIAHAWTHDDESFDARWSFAPPDAGVYRVRVRVTTPDVAEAVADDLVVARDASLRVLVYEPRPSWPVTFVRQSLESDESFDVASTARTSRPARTLSIGSPRSLPELVADRFDVVIAGALDELSEADLEAIDRFASTRGGSVVLLPDRQLPASVRRRFELPRADEVLLEKPAAMEGESPRLQASELLLFPSVPTLRPLAVVRHAATTRPAIVGLDRGEGRLIVSGALDAWRHRAADDFAMFWRALAADAAVASPQRVEVSVEPPIARPGDDVRLIVNLRRTEFDDRTSTIDLPPVSASLVGTPASAEPIRLWPGPRLGSFTARLRAPAPGRYTVSASIAGASTEVPLIVADDVVHAAKRSASSIAYAARATGGAVLEDPKAVANAIDRIDTGVESRTTRPMRSIWWIVPFTALLCAEWTLRRRTGRR